MTQTKSAAAAKKAAAARDEVDPQPKSFEWRGISFTLPDSLPATFAFDMADLEADDAGTTEVFRFLSGIIGVDQLAKVRAKIAEDGDRLDQLDEILADFLGLALAPYGMSSGEQVASAVS